MSSNVLPQRRVAQTPSERCYELGVQGRKTGVIVAEQERDEYGFEVVESFFSSPERSDKSGIIQGPKRPLKATQLTADLGTLDTVFKKKDQKGPYQQTVTMKVDISQK
ncbi:hypothetical protein F4774DRAFT_396034 [Daldinia eschscholtzii]|nr:hypothetical protein F4774DRAFT_396034 [Daldinia eschscholtzii]